MDKYLPVIGRVMLAHIFLLAGINKISGYAGTQGYMDSMGVPGSLLPLVILVEIAGGLALIVGWKTRWAALGLAGFTIIAAFLFHFNLADRMQSILFMKNISISGGLLLLAAYGAGAFSLDKK